jgi:hypothetical protein
MMIGNWADESHAFRTSAVDISLEVFPSAELICRDRVQDHGQPSYRPSRGVHPILTDTNSYKITQTWVQPIPSLLQGLSRYIFKPNIIHTSAEELKYTSANSANGYLTC